ncbi:hypothetical protein V3W47_16555 [Deinococcus sp. YIM 134068]|uniref:hypothetical protein n=1 Tax=Deinococcus lichenicola TaxID=3118910 RepID=UPI002F921848
MPSRRKTSLPDKLQGATKKNIIGERLRLARHHHTPPLTADALSALVYERYGLDITPNMISKVEGGFRAAFDYEVRAFAAVLKLSSDWLLGLTERKTLLTDT